MGHVTQHISVDQLQHSC